MPTPTKPEGTVVVTGATGGIGAATAREFVAKGWPRLLLSDIDEGRLESVAAPLRESGATVDVLAGDVSEPAWASGVIDALGGSRVAALVHAAGLSPRQADPARILAVNLDATIRLVDTVRDHMASGSAAVLIASNSSYFPLPPEAVTAVRELTTPDAVTKVARHAPTPEMAYPVSKMGVRALVTREAANFGKLGVRLVSLSPGAVDTPMTEEEVPNSEPAQRMIARSAVGRIGRPEELAAVAVFLTSPEASFVAGVDWLVDGGQTAAMGLL